MIRSTLFLFICLFSTTARAEIDLGELEVSGEVRRPLLDVVDSDVEAKKRALKMIDQELARFEQALLKQNNGDKGAQHVY